MIKTDITIKRALFFLYVLSQLSKLVFCASQTQHFECKSHEHINRSKQAKKKGDKKCTDTEG